MAPTRDRERFQMIGFVMMIYWSLFWDWFTGSNALSNQERRWIRTILVKADRVLNSRTTTAAVNVMLVIMVLAAIAMTLIVMDKDVANWFWENLFSQPWWPMPQTPLR